jgi:hypothetical protein
MACFSQIVNTRLWCVCSLSFCYNDCVWLLFVLHILYVMYRLVTYHIENACTAKRNKKYVTLTILQVLSNVQHMAIYNSTAECAWNSYEILSSFYFLFCLVFKEILRKQLLLCISDTGQIHDQSCYQSYDLLVLFHPIQ